MAGASSRLSARAAVAQIVLPVLLALVPTLAVGAETPAAVDHDRSPAAPLTAAQRAACAQLDLDADEIGRLAAKPLYRFSEAEVDVYLRFLQAAESDLRRRIAHLARKNIGQPYQLYLLGELPFEHYDPQPLYCLAKSDCLVFAEHTYAMALAPNWPTFMALLQRIRYRDGKIGVVTRNHFTEAGWNPANQWLVRDVTRQLAGARAVAFAQKIDRARFLKKRYGLEVDIPLQQHRDAYLRFEDVSAAKPHLRDGDFVNIVRGIAAAGPAANQTFGGSAWVGHVGLIVRGNDGQVHLIHSAKPAVREEPLDAYITRSTADIATRDAAGKSRLLGFKFLRLEREPLANLRQVDGPTAPKISLPTAAPF